MKQFISRDKLSKKARRLLDGRKRLIWPRSPAPQIMENRKTYNRHRKSHDFQDDWIRGIFDMSGSAVNAYVPDTVNKRYAFWTAQRDSQHVCLVQKDLLQTPCVKQGVFCLRKIKTCYACHPAGMMTVRQTRDA